ncbi:Alpha/Beta hydrolase protein [Diaporthe sp. PMI_573]|nr:Alpha/Beta hydrolase protein [Diaporthaceae sp. PMI_573]
MEGFDPTDMTRFEDFHIIKKVYKTVNGHAIDLDILYPKTLSVPRPSDPASPVLLRFHGGGLVTGSSLFPLFFAPWLLQLVQRHSAVVVSPNYRLIPESTVQESVDDANDALQWVRQELARVMLDEAGIRVDVDRIMTAGDSAGGYLSLQVGLSHPDEIRAVTAAYPMVDMTSPYFTGQYTKKVFIAPETPKETVSAHLREARPRETKAIISSDPLLERGTLMFGLIQHGLFGDLFPTHQRGLFPLFRIEDGARFPRGGVLVWHGKDDSVVPAEGSLKLREAVSKHDPDLNFRLAIREGEHGFDQTADIDDQWAAEALSGCLISWLQ